MSLRFCSFASGSSGNSYVLASDTTSNLIDAGISGRYILEGLTSMGIEHSELSAILVTHEHVDHIKSLPMIHKRTGFTKIYTGEGTARYITEKGSLPLESFEFLRPEDGPFFLGDITVTPFRVSHDAEEPMGFSFEHGGKIVSIVTDTGVITEEIFSKIVESDFIALEANHEINMLYMSRYPYNLITRILSDHGHVSNDHAAECLVRILRERNNKRPPRLAMAHLSNNSNTQDLVRVTINNILFENGFVQDRDYHFEILDRDNPSQVFQI